MTRELTTSDFEKLTKLGQSFFSEGKLPGAFKPDVFVKNWTYFLGHKMGVLFGVLSGEQIVGAFGGIVFPDPNDGELVAMETFWYVLPGFRGRAVRLLKRFEEWAKQRGAMRVMMVHLLTLTPEKLSVFYERMGYRAVEVHYVKEI